MSELALQLIAENKKTKNPFLDLGNCGLTELPEELFECIWLTRLNLGDLYYSKDSNNSIRCSNKGDENNLRKANLSLLEKLTGLQTLYLSSNQITDYSFLEKLTGLQTLYISHNQIVDISFLEKLTGLQTLDLSSNQIANISFLEKLTGLQTLDLSYNQITDISFLEKLTGLQTLDLSHNQITDISFLEKLTGLQTLYLSYNQIMDISFLENLTGLQTLYLGHNQITDISFLENLTGLQTLYLGHNQITDISFLEKLTGLQTLDFSYNQITDISALLPLMQKGIPINLGITSNVNEISLYSNPINTPPLEIVEQGNEAIIRYFSAGKLIPLNECKLIFIGDGGVGKTCLMKRIVYDEFNPNESMTHGINKIAWQEIIDDKNKSIKVNLWDFGGQEIQQSLHQFFFSERVIYVLVLNPRNDVKAPYWIEQIEKLGSGSEVLIVYNWKDKEDKNAYFLQNFYELRKKYNKLPDPFVLSVKTGDGMEKFKEAVKEAVLRSEGLVQAYPEKWYNIKNKLEENVSVGKNYIYYEEYQQWCNEYGYNNEDDQRALLIILNMIGSIVFFDRPVLNRYQVLNPEWITTGAYSVLTSLITKEKHGHLTNNDLREIFKDEKEIFSNKQIKIRYNESQFQFIIQLMLEYCLCQENPSNRNEYLIPAAFGEKPKKNYESHKKNSRVYRIQFESPFEMLVIHRFIAKNLSKAVGEDYWQAGVFIKDTKSNTYALVETNLHSLRIDLWIKGENIRGFWESIAEISAIFSVSTKISFIEKKCFIKKIVLKYFFLIRKCWTA